jgi:hypothetical protein
VKGFCRVSHGRWCGSLQYSGRVKGTGVHEPHLAHPLRKVPIHRTVHFKFYLPMLTAPLPVLQCRRVGSTERHQVCGLSCCAPRSASFL